MYFEICLQFLQLKCTYIVLSKTTKVILKTPEEPFEQVTLRRKSGISIAEFLVEFFFLRNICFDSCIENNILEDL